MLLPNVGVDLALLRKIGELQTISSFSELALKAANDATAIMLGGFSAVNVFWPTVNEFPHFLLLHKQKIAFHGERA